LDGICEQWFPWPEGPDVHYRARLSDGYC
jgi:hypothetical protein